MLGSFICSLRKTRVGNPRTRDVGRGKHLIPGYFGSLEVHLHEYGGCRSRRRCMRSMQRVGLPNTLPYSARSRIWGPTSRLKRLYTYQLLGGGIQLGSTLGRWSSPMINLGLCEVSLAPCKSRTIISDGLRAILVSFLPRDYRHRHSVSETEVGHHLARLWYRYCL